MTFVLTRCKRKVVKQNYFEFIVKCYGLLEIKITKAWKLVKTLIDV